MYLADNIDQYNIQSGSRANHRAYQLLDPMLSAETVLIYIEKEIVAKYNRAIGLDAGKYSIFNRLWKS